MLVPTGTTLLGLVRHLTDGERFWFGYHLTGVGSAPDWDAGMSAPDGSSTEEIVAGYREAIAASDEAIARIGDPEALSRWTSPASGSRYVGPLRT